MRRLLKYTTLILMVLMISGSVWAATYLDHVTVAPNNKGDVLIFPWYMAIDGGWQTKLTVINTNQTECVVAKLIIRSFKTSEELLDFFVYLSPADVWTGIMRYDNMLRKTVIFSDDDSVLSQIAPTLVWANAAPINQVLFPLTCGSDADYLGYIEVITAAAGWVEKQPRFNDAPGVKKLNIYNAYEALISGVGNPQGLKLNGTYTAATGGMANWLAGFMQVQNSAAGLDSTISATTLKDYGNLAKLNTSVETKLGFDANNNLAEIEAALSKDDIAQPYSVGGDDLTLHFFTFPTKLTATCAAGSGIGPYFKAIVDGCPDFNIITYDLMENSPKSGSPFSGGGSNTYEFCSEVNYVDATAFPYDEGWAHYMFNHTTVTTNMSSQYLSYEGTPVIPSYLYLGTGGLTANYAAWTDDMVYCSAVGGTNKLVDYQYSDSVGCVAL